MRVYAFSLFHYDGSESTLTECRYGEFNIKMFKAQLMATDHTVHTVLFSHWWWA